MADGRLPEFPDYAISMMKKANRIVYFVKTGAIGGIRLQT